MQLPPQIHATVYTKNCLPGRFISIFPHARLMEMDFFFLSLVSKIIIQRAFVPLSLRLRAFSPEAIYPYIDALQHKTKSSHGLKPCAYELSIQQNFGKLLDNCLP